MSQLGRNTDGYGGVGVAGGCMSHGRGEIGQGSSVSKDWLHKQRVTSRACRQMIATT